MLLFSIVPVLFVQEPRVRGRNDRCETVNLIIFKGWFYNVIPLYGFMAFGILSLSIKWFWKVDGITTNQFHVCIPGSYRNTRHDYYLKGKQQTSDINDFQKYCWRMLFPGWEYRSMFRMSYFLLKHMFNAGAWFFQRNCRYILRLFYRRQTNSRTNRR